MDQMSVNQNLKIEKFRSVKFDDGPDKTNIENETISIPQEYDGVVGSHNNTSMNFNKPYFGQPKDSIPISESS